MPVDPVEFGRVLERLSQQDRQLEALRADMGSLLEMANRGKGAIAVLMILGSALGAVLGWFSGRWFK